MARTFTWCLGSVATACEGLVKPSESTLNLKDMYLHHGVEIAKEVGGRIRGGGLEEEFGVCV